MSALAQLLMRLLAMQMPCRLFCSAWHLFWHANCSDIYWAFGAPEEIRTPDPQIRSLVEPIEIIRVRYRKGRLSRLSLEFSMHRFKARYRTERCSNLGGISPAKTEIIA
jgi:hypothetical protein